MLYYTIRFYDYQMVYSSENTTLKDINNDIKNIEVIVKKEEVIMIIKCDICRPSEKDEISKSSEPFIIENIEIPLCEKCHQKLINKLIDKKNACPICGMENCEKKKDGDLSEQNLNEVIKILKKSVYQIEDYNIELEIDNFLKTILKAIIDHIKTDINKLISNIKNCEIEPCDMNSDLNKEVQREAVFHCLKKLDSNNKTTKINKVISDFIILKHSIYRINSNILENINNNIMLEDIDTDINNLNTYLSYKIARKNIRDFPKSK